MIKAWMIAATLALAPLAVVGCSSGEPKTAEDAKADLEPIDELKAIPVDLGKEVDDIFQPIADVDIVVDGISHPDKLGVDKANLTKACKAVFDGAPEVTIEVAPEHKADYDAFMLKMKGIGPGLKAIPEKVAAFVPKLGTTLVKVPVLSTKATASLTATANNPFGDKDKKAKAAADLKDLEKVKTDIAAKVDDIKKRATGLPAKAAEASAKLTVALAAK